MIIVTKKLMRTTNIRRLFNSIAAVPPAIALLMIAFATGGYADLHEVHRWNLEFLEGSSQDSKYRAIADRIGDCLNFISGLLIIMWLWFTYLSMLLGSI